VDDDFGQTWFPKGRLKGSDQVYGGPRLWVNQRRGSGRPKSESADQHGQGRTNAERAFGSNSPSAFVLAVVRFSPRCRFLADQRVSP
jgi:hypothetical protein